MVYLEGESLGDSDAKENSNDPDYVPSPTKKIRGCSNKSKGWYISLSFLGSFAAPKTPSYDFTPSVCPCVRLPVNNIT